MNIPTGWYVVKISGAVPVGAVCTDIRAQQATGGDVARMLAMVPYNPTDKCDIAGVLSELRAKGVRP